jgi:outer membrane biosynthesis protein TonB
VVRSIQFHMSKYLAAILGLCALTTPSVAAVVSGGNLPQLSQDTQPPAAAAPSNSPQDSPPNAPPVEPAQSGAEPQAEPSATPTPEPAKEPQKAKPETTAKKPASQAKASNKKRRRKTAASTPTATPEKKVVRNGGTADPAVQLAPSMSAEQASNQRQNTTQLLTLTDANLKQISSRPMNSSQQDSISQIRQYMEQAKAAEQAGDLERARNLASKALLLSDDLVKQ